jgi:hypothetical protein
VRDLEDRLANATAMIECLNKRLHEQTNGSEMNNINEILQRMREQMLSEFVKYKKDTEDSVNKVCRPMSLESQQQREPASKAAVYRDSSEVNVASCCCFCCWQAVSSELRRENYRAIDAIP